MSRKTAKRVYIKTFSLRRNPLEYFLVALSCGIFFVLFLSQVGLVVPQARSELTDIDVFEGTDIAGELPEASFVLESDSAVADSAIVLLNGAPYCSFSSGRCTITVLNRGLVEIDGRQCERDFSVTAKTVDSKLQGITDGDTFRIGRGMTIIGRVEVQNDSE